MLTVKHVNQLGFEEVFQAIVIKSMPLTPDAMQLPNGVSYYLDFERPVGEGIKVIHDGKVYIMNETGKTVATYDLGCGAMYPSIGQGQITSGTWTNPKITAGILGSSTQQVNQVNSCSSGDLYGQTRNNTSNPHANIA